MNLIKVAPLLVVAMLGVAASHASAASYHAYLCRVPYGPNIGAPASTEAVTFTTNHAGGFARDTCPTGGAMSAGLDGATHAFSEGASLIYDAPGGLTISAFTAWRHERAGPVQLPAAPFTNIQHTGVLSAEGGPCQQNGGCSERGVAAQPFATENRVAAANLSDVTQIRFDAFCGGSGGTCPATGGSISTAVDVFALDVLLNDPTAPAVSGAGGPLLAGGAVAGTQPATFKVDDAGSGVHKGSITVDGTVVSETILGTGTCANLGASPDGLPSFAGTRPCPASVDTALSLNTDDLAPGTHAVSVRVADAAGNQTVVGSTSITTSGPRPAGTPNGAGASRFAKLAARFAGKTARTRRLGFTARPTITGRLIDEHGRPIAGAAVDVAARERRSGAPTLTILTVTTGADGTFRTRLPSGPSRSIAVQYTAFAEDPKPASAVKLSAIVRASLTASVAPRSPRVRTPLRLTGRLRHLPRKGIVVLIQARDRRRWRTIDSVETRADGRFAWRYRFSARSGGLTFAFRARVKSPSYPFGAGNSRTITVRVRR